MTNTSINPVRIGIVGYGNWSEKIHIPYLLSRQDVIVVGICENDNKRLLTIDNKFINQYTDHKLFYDNNELDAVIVSTPHYLHYDQIKYALERNYHVLVDKPLACNSRDASELVELAAQKKRYLVVANQRRYDEGYKFIRKIIAKNEIGNLQAIHGIFAQQIFDDFEESWRSRPHENCGGILADSGYHLIDTLLWASGAIPVSIFANLSQQGLAAEKTASVNIKFNKDVLATMLIFRGAPENTGLEELVFYGENGCIIYRREKLMKNKACNLTQISLNGDIIFQKTIKPASGWEPTANYLNAITFSEEVISSGESNLATVQTIETAYKSTLTGRAEFLVNIAHQ